MAGEQSGTTFTFKKDCSIELLEEPGLAVSETLDEASPSALALKADPWRQRIQGGTDERQRPYDRVGETGLSLLLSR